MTVSVLPAPPAKLPMTSAAEGDVAARTPIWPAPLPWLRIATVSSASRPVTVSVPPSKLSSGSVKVTSASMICGAALTVFSRKVTGVVRPVSVGTEFAMDRISLRIASGQKRPDELRPPPARGARIGRHGNAGVPAFLRFGRNYLRGLNQQLSCSYATSG